LPPFPIVIEARVSALRLDILVNNAVLFGKLPMRGFAEIPEDKWDRVMAVNVRGTWQAAVAAAPAMKKSGGRSLVVSGLRRVAFVTAQTIVVDGGSVMH
jgi:NAD(P)-dependent dehydrogenase (short-subunit alcohol dehydrogenase family)